MKPNLNGICLSRDVYHLHVKVGKWLTSLERRKPSFSKPTISLKLKIAHKKTREPKNPFQNIAHLLGWFCLTNWFNFERLYLKIRKLIFHSFQRIAILWILSTKSTITQKIKNQKTDFSFVSAYCASYKWKWPLLSYNNFFWPFMVLF